MPSKWPIDITFKEIVLCVNEMPFQQCGSDLAICSHREHCIGTKEGAAKLFFQQAHCSNKRCFSRSTLINPESELTITMLRIEY